MPFSHRQGKKESVAWILSAGNINSVLDIGVGSGTYSTLLRKSRPILANAKWYGIEAWSNYISEYDLNKKYDVLFNEDARRFDWSKLPNIDLTIFGDVLEHMTKLEAQELVNVALNYSKYVLISIPIQHAPQGASYGNPFEIHVKDNWSHEEMLESFPYIKNSLKCKSIGIYWLNKE